MRPILYLVFVLSLVFLINLKDRPRPVDRIKVDETPTESVETTAQMTALFVRAGQLYTGDKDGRLRVLSLSDGHLVADWYAHPVGLRQVFFFDDKLISVGRGGSVATWLPNGELIKRRRLVGHHLNDAVLIADDDMVVAADRGVVARIGLGQRWRTNGIHGRATFGLALSPDGEQIVSVGTDGMARIWSVERGQVLREWAAHKGWVTSVVWDKKGLWTLGVDAALTRWDPLTGRSLRTINTVADKPNKLLANDAYFVVIGSDHRVIVFQRDDLDSITTLDLSQRPFSSATLSEKSLWLGYRTGGISSWDVTNGREGATLPTKF
ncbi:MAG: hypothetical protein CMH52_02105 [Myxococcales bacterium]|nr:hypothetical protein [Myxococcales bacterium]